MMLPSPSKAEALIRFINATPTPFHFVAKAAEKLERVGFKKLRETDAWNLEAGGKYYFSRNQAALVAFTLPKTWKEGCGVSIVGTHVDSPNLRVRPVSKKTSADYLQVGAETYGGGLWHTWFDRDLSIAGRVVTVDSDRRGQFHSRLVKVDRPILRIPSLAIHLSRGSSSDFKFNTETEFVPILGLVEQQLNQDSSKASEKASKKTALSIQQNHHTAFISLLANEMSVAPEEIHDFELCLYDTQPSVLGGINNEFIFSPRMDNQFSSFCAVEALAEFVQSQSFSNLDGNVNCIALFNHEEIGSVSSSGAQSNLIPILFNRLSPSPEAMARSIASSFLISSDMGHAIHPNYTSKHEENHKPKINGGVVIKTNAGQRYATDSNSTFIAKQLIEKTNGKVQEYEVRNDMPCGSTVGPALSALGLRTVDVGCAMLSMHSIRETAGALDVQYCIDFFTSFFEGFASLDKQLNID